MSRLSPQFEARMAQIELEGLKSAAGKLQLGDDPETMLRALAYIGGRVASLRGYTKRRIREAGVRDEP